MRKLGGSPGGEDVHASLHVSVVETGHPRAPWTAHSRSVCSLLSGGAFNTALPAPTRSVLISGDLGVAEATRCVSQDGNQMALQSFPKRSPLTHGISVAGSLVTRARSRATCRPAASGAGSWGLATAFNRPSW